MDTEEEHNLSDQGQRCQQECFKSGTNTAQVRTKRVIMQHDDLSSSSICVQGYKTFSRGSSVWS